MRKGWLPQVAKVTTPPSLSVWGSEATWALHCASHQAYRVGDCLLGDEPGDQRPLLGAESHANLRSGLYWMSGFISLKVTGELVSQPHLHPPKMFVGWGAPLSFSILEGTSRPRVAVLHLCLPLWNAQLCPAVPSSVPGEWDRK